MKDPQDRFEELLDKLREQDYRITPQRLALLRLLSISEAHPRAADVHEQLREQFPTISLATVYKTLNLLKEMGEVRELSFCSDDARYDGHDPSPHPHLVCVRCHKIIDLDAADLDGLEQDVASNYDFRIMSHRLDFFGICSECKHLESD
jgi:Fur family peroxide stress response transcriptional regulator